MTVVFMESFDGVSTIAQLVNGATSLNASRWSPNFDPVGNSDIDASGRTGQCFRRTNDNGRQIRSRAFGLGTTAIVGFAYKPGSVNITNNDTEDFFELRDEDDLAILKVRRINATILAHTQAGAAFTTAAVLDTTSFHYLEFRFVLADAGGVVELKRNGTIIGSFAGDTKAATSAGIEYVCLSGRSGAGVGGYTNDRYDDLYVDSSTYRDEAVIQCIRPSGDGAASGWVNSASTQVANYSYVDEQNVSDADYVQSFADADKDTYAFGDVSSIATHTVKAVQVTTRALYVDAVKDLAHVHRLGAVEADSADITLAATANNYSSLRETDPNGDAWTVANVNAAEWGIKQRPV